VLVLNVFLFDYYLFIMYALCIVIVRSANRFIIKVLYIIVVALRIITVF
jgi:hypothetical protein